MLKQGWEILNAPLVILLVGSGIGFLFVRLVWEPLTARRIANEKRAAFRREVKFRLANAQLKLNKIRWNYEGEVAGSALESKSPASYIDPAYQSWALHALIYAGWGSKVFEDCYPLIDQLSDATTGPDTAREKFVELEKKLPFDPQRDGS